MKLGAMPAGRGVVAVSGGADSVALLRLLAARGLALAAAHVNHQLRGAESDADKEFVRDLAASLDVPFHSTRIEIHGGNLEATARRLRYDWFTRLADELDAPWIATGHTANDQAETVLHRLVRGTGLQGLRGIQQRPLPPTPSPKRGGGADPSPPPRFGEGAGRRGCALLRPLLTVSRNEILSYLASLNQPYRTDSSNADPRFTRNRIRAELLPLIETFNPGAVSVLGRIATQADEAFAFLESEAQTLLLRAEKPLAADTVILDRSALESAPPILVRTALRLVWEREVWPMGEMDFDHWTAAATFADRDFPGGVSLRAVGRVVQLARRE